MNWVEWYLILLCYWMIGIEVVQQVAPTKWWTPNSFPLYLLLVALWPLLMAARWFLLLATRLMREPAP